MSATSEAPDAGVRKTPVKVVVAGGFGTGKSTFVNSVSQIAPLNSEAVMTDASAHVDDLALLADKDTTTVAMDFGRIDLNAEIALYLFGTPGQERYHFMWNELTRGAFGAVVLADTRRLAECFPAIDFFEARRVPFVVAVNTFDGHRTHPIEEIREAVQVNPDVPMLFADARRRADVRAALIAVVDRAIAVAEPPPRPERERESLPAPAPGTASTAAPTAAPAT